jgi:hypothetical protein
MGGMAELMFNPIESPAAFSKDIDKIFVMRVTHLEQPRYDTVYI